MTALENLQFKDYYFETLYMSANVETGVLTNRSGRRMLALTNDFLIGLHRALESECGDRAGQVLYRCGKKWGKNFGKALAAAWAEFYETPFNQFPLAFFQSLLVQEFACNGWGILTPDYQHFAQGVIVLHLNGAIMSEIRDSKLEYPHDILTAGIVAGMFSEFVQIELDCHQTQSGQGPNKESLFLLSSSDRMEQLSREAASLAGHAAMLDYLLNTRN